jgi:hypothetical protein
VPHKINKFCHTNRTKQVQIIHKEDKHLKTTCLTANLSKYKVAQVCVLGPQLFIMYVNDLPILKRAKTLMYVYDTSFLNFGR